MQKRQRQDLSRRTVNPHKIIKTYPESKMLKLSKNFQNTKLVNNDTNMDYFANAAPPHNHSQEKGKESTGAVSNEPATRHDLRLGVRKQGM